VRGVAEPSRRGAAIQILESIVRRSSIASLTSKCVHSRLPQRWHDLIGSQRPGRCNVLGPPGRRVYSHLIPGRIFSASKPARADNAQCNAPSAFVPNPSTHADLHNGLRRTGRVGSATPLSPITNQRLLRRRRYSRLRHEQFRSGC
jgi:hypothetical protein